LRVAPLANIQMLNQVQTTLPAEIRDFPEWHHGRASYAVWVLTLEEEAIRDKFAAARAQLDGYLLEPYGRQPHITLFVCGFLVEKPQYNDDFTQAQLQNQIQALEETSPPPFEIEIGGLNSFASAPFLEVHDPNGGIARLREVLSRGAREFRTAPYTPHLTVGLYADTFPSVEVARRLVEFPKDPIRSRVIQIVFSTYRAQEIAGRLTYQHEVNLIGHKQDF
jgi:2'-5' RNA ligase